MKSLVLRLLHLIYVLTYRKEYYTQKDNNSPGKISQGNTCYQKGIECTLCTTNITNIVELILIIQTLHNSLLQKPIHNN